jgi:hypothetical protein
MIDSFIIPFKQTRTVHLEPLKVYLLKHTASDLSRTCTTDLDELERLREEGVAFGSVVDSQLDAALLFVSIVPCWSTVMLIMNLGITAICKTSSPSFRMMYVLYCIY